MPIVYCTFLSGTLHRAPWWAPWWAPWYSVGPLVYQGAQCPPCGVVLSMFTVQQIFCSQL